MLWQATDAEHEEILRLASVLLLGYLLPHSTGTSAHLLRHAPHRTLLGRDLAAAAAAAGRTQPLGERFDPTRYLASMCLEERLEQSVLWWSSCDAVLNDDMQLQDEAVELAFHGFLWNGLAPLLRSRPLPVAECPLLTVLAMAIHPLPGLDPNLNPITHRHLNQTNSRLWQRTKALMTRTPHASQFHIHDGNRYALIELLRSSLRLPALLEASEHPTTLLLHGSVPHLRASIRSWARGFASTAREAHAAHSVLAHNLAVDTQHLKIVEEEWNYLLRSLAEDRNVGDLTAVQDATQTSDDDEHASSQPSTCMYTARGRLLSEFLARLYMSPASAQRMRAFLSRAVRSLTDAIEWQIDCWVEHRDERGGELVADNRTHPTSAMQDAPESEKSADVVSSALPEHPPQLLAALVSVATTLIRVLPLKGDHDVKGSTIDDGEDDDDPFTTLNVSSIQLLGHPNLDIALAASELVTVSWSRSFNEGHAALLLKVLRQTLLSSHNELDVRYARIFDPVVAIACQRSSAFAHTLCRTLFKVVGDRSGAEERREQLIRLISVVSANHPIAASKSSDEISSLVTSTSVDRGGKLHLVASILSLRHARFFGPDSQIIERNSLTLGTSWDVYRLACHALRTGNPSVASEMFRSVLRVASLSETHYLWLSALEALANADSYLIKKGAIGLPFATVKLRSSLALLKGFESLGSVSTRCSIRFQAHYLLLRLDFLDLVTVFRQLTKEMRLTASPPQKNTRPLVHVRNVARAFVALSGRYVELHRQNGLAFHSTQSGAALKLWYCASLFMGQAVISCFSDALPASMNSNVFAPSLLDGSEKHPMSLLMRRLHDLVLESMDASVEPLIRAAATLELIDGMLLVPAPFCADFLHPTPKLVPGRLVLTPSPDEQLRESPQMDRDADHQQPVVVEGSPSLSFTVVCSGRVFLEDILSKHRQVVRRLSCWELRIRYRISYSGPLSLSTNDDVDDGGVVGEDNTEEAAATEDPSVERGGSSRATSKDGLSIPAQPPSVLSSQSDTLAVTVPTHSNVLCSSSPVAISLYPDGSFYVPILFPPLVEEGLYELQVMLSLLDYNGQEWRVSLLDLNDGESASGSIPIRISRGR